MLRAGRSSILALVALTLSGCGALPTPTGGVAPISDTARAAAWSPLRDLVRGEMMAGFDSYDANRDAHLDRHEIPFLRPETFQALDRNHDGTISRDEGSPGESDLAAGLGLMSGAMEAAFHALDLNGNGKLEPSELSATVEMLGGRGIGEALDYAGWVEAIAQAPAPRAIAPLRVSAGDRPPVVLVPGFFLPTHIWIPLAAKLRERGWVNQATVPHWPSFGDIRDYSAAADFQIKRLMSQTGATHVDVIGHSMGGLVLRYWAKHMGGAALISHYVSFGTPHHGTEIGHLWPCTSTDQMLPSSAFLADLNADDETPGPGRYTSIRTNYDEIVLSATSPVLDGADNHLVPFVEHLELVWHPQTQAIAFDALEH